MNNFVFVNPVKIIFGEDTIQNLATEIPTGSRILIIYGGGSIKKNDVYTQVLHALKGFEFFEFPGIEPNPHYETCMKAVAFIKEKAIDYALAVGGGSVIDATKFIVAAARFKEGDPWQMNSDKVPATDAIPFGTILTLPATGSEMNSAAVITRAETQDKLAFFSPHVFPRFSILDPTITYTLPPRQIGNGVVDTFVHVIEQYLTYNERNTLLQDHLSEALLKTLVIEGPKALENPTDYDVRANLMLASTWALNGLLACGVSQDWATHRIGHEITAFYGLDHAQTLAIILPGMMTALKEQKAKKIIRLGTEVFGLQAKTDNELIEKTIEATEAFFHTMGVKTRLSDYNLGDEAIDKVCERLKDRKWDLGECKNVDYQMAGRILSLRK